jgi:hypothetical protein
MNNTAQSQRQTIVREWEAQQSATSQLESPANEKGETPMKSAGTMITICLLLTASTLFAQSESQRPMKVNVPFAFGVEDLSLPAGEYYIFTATRGRTIRIVSADGKYSAVIDTLLNHAQKPATKSRLVFHKYGIECFLAQVWTAGQNDSRNLLSGKRAMELASSGSRPQTMTVIAVFAGR